MKSYNNLQPQNRRVIRKYSSSCSSLAQKARKKSQIHNVRLELVSVCWHEIFGTVISSSFSLLENGILTSKLRDTLNQLASH